MSFLLSEAEVKSVLEQLEVESYYISIDMDGVMTLYLSPLTIDREAEILEKLGEQDQNRKTDQIEGMLYPFNQIMLDDYDDEGTAQRFATKKIIRAKYHQQLNTWMVKPRTDRPNDLPPCVTFYSYKGGVGRSTSLAVVARLLAKEGYKVAVIDLDLEAPGLNNLLLVKSRTTPFGVVDYLHHKPWLAETLDKKRFMEQYIIREEVLRSNNQDPGELWVMTASGTRIRNKDKMMLKKNPLHAILSEPLEIRLDPSYLKKLSYIDFDLYVRQQENVFAELLKDVAEYTKADVIFLDGRTGLSNVSGALLKQFSDVISLHVQDNPQNREGIELLVEELKEHDLFRRIIWNHTKVPKDYDRKEDRFGRYIRNVVNQAVSTSSQSEEKPDRISPPIFALPYFNVLEDVTATRLQKCIEDNDIPVAYKELAKKITDETGIDRKLADQISCEEAEQILVELAEKARGGSAHPVYISRRFLNPDLKWFVGFRGSGKKTLEQFLKGRRKSSFKVVSVEDKESLPENTHELLSSVVFLDWTYEESAQVACKWLLQSETLVKWLKGNRQVKGMLQDEDFTKIEQADPLYELPNDLVELLLASFFWNEDLFLVSGWRDIFNLLQYREGHVLPRDVITTLRAVAVKTGENIIQKTPDLSGAPLLPIRLNSFLFYQMLEDTVGKEKREWLRECDSRLVRFVTAYKKTMHVELNGEISYELDWVRDEFCESKKENRSSITHEMFEEIVQTALHLHILNEEAYSEYSLNPVYHLIPMDDED